VKFAEQELVQLRPEGSEVTTPFPLTLTVRVGVTLDCGWNRAVTSLVESIRTRQVEAVPLQAPPQPTKRWPRAAEATKVTTESASNADEQMGPH
jgi:hypothetical protein